MQLGWVGAAVLSVATAVAQETPGSITGTVVDLAGSQVPDATVTIVGPASLETKTDASGEFVISRLSPGTYKLRIQEPGFVTRDLEFRIEVGKETSLGRVGLEVAPRMACLGEFNRPQIHETKLRSGSQSGVWGTLVADAALTHETITLLAAGTHSLIETTKTDQSGRFQFADVPPGIYELLVSSDGPMLTLKVRRGHELEVRLTWKSWPQGQLCL
jgi:hypothetical protein